ncbi:MAG TPA: DUF421 domain-containing protein [Anaerolineae bacterium]|nr:DUF421 domain-containing protein [Anaerolineae bacterium]HOQ99402.1 DUF421 domain-containing protein [Anaerolineae bacterium]HPL27806.1 DUF421 domain-containing protein [Anaerolineae bacterium]
MPTGLANLGVPLWQLIVRPIVVYLALLLGLRALGKRQIGQFTLFDLILILLVANAMQPAMTGPDTSLVGGLIIVGVLLGFNWLIDWLETHVGLFQYVFLGQPTVIAQDGQWLPDAMRREGVDRAEAEAALREHGIETVEEARLVVLEVDGTISVVPREAEVLRTRRRVRFTRRP